MKKKIKYALIALFVMVSFASKAHDYYIAIFEINESRDGKSLQISAKFIAHDVEEAMMRQDYPYLNMNSRNEHPDTDSLLFDYFSKNFSVMINQNKAPMVFVGKELGLDEDFGFTLKYLLPKQLVPSPLPTPYSLENFPSNKTLCIQKLVL
jgi:hypothetical protein